MIVKCGEYNKGNDCRNNKSNYCRYDKRKNERNGIRMCKEMCERKHIETDNSGVISVEASVVMFMVMVIVCLCIYGMMYVLNCETIRSYMYEKIYTAPLIETSQYISDGARNNGLGDLLMWCDDYSLTGMAGSDSITMIGRINMHGETGLGCSTEFGVCTDRLRRWQMYDDIAEESLGE